MTGIEEVDLESIWNETDDEGNVVSAEQEADVVVEEEAPAVDEGADEGDEFEEDAPETAEAAAEEPEVEEIDYKALYQKEKQRADSAAGRLRAEADRREKERDSQAGAPTPPAVVAPTEEDEFLTKFQEEYSPEVIKAINILAARQAAQIVDQTIQTRVAPVERTTLDMVEQAHYNAIEAAHPDVYDIDESPEFDAWIESKPQHTKGAYQYVRERGTPAEVISMLNEYKTATRKTTSIAPPKEKVQAAMGVQRRRGTTPVASEPSQTDEKALWDSIPD
jgi:hypothetical protein